MALVIDWVIVEAFAKANLTPQPTKTSGAETKTIDLSEHNRDKIYKDILNRTLE